MRVTLIPHPATPTTAVTRIDVDVRRPDAQTLVLRYLVTGDIGNVRVPPLSPPARTDELWKHTCLEVFLRPGAGARYFEINVAPSSCWAAYVFDDYRTGMRTADDLEPALVRGADHPALFDPGVLIDFGATGVDAATWSIGLSAVMEEVSGAKSYWALAHPGERPDFHDPRSFTLELPVPDAP